MFQCCFNYSFRTLRRSLDFLLPVLVDSNFNKCQIFCISRFTTDIIAAWIRDELKKLVGVVPHSILVEKLTGDNTRAEKERVMRLFKEGVCQVLVCTDVAGMGVDIPDLNFSINVGIPTNSWKMKQIIGRIGRAGQKSISITLVYPQKGSYAPESVLREIFKGNECLREGMNGLFKLTNPLVDYSESPAIVNCEVAECEFNQNCQCSSCCCCSNCNSYCSCQFSVSEYNEVMEKILGLGDASYKSVLSIMSSRVSSDDEYESAEEVDGSGSEKSDSSGEVHDSGRFESDGEELSDN